MIVTRQDLSGDHLRDRRVVKIIPHQAAGSQYGRCLILEP
jgi:hypothetical protein